MPPVPAAYPTAFLFHDGPRCLSAANIYVTAPSQTLYRILLLLRAAARRAMDRFRWRPVQW